MPANSNADHFKIGELTVKGSHESCKMIKELLSQDRFKQLVAVLSAQVGVPVTLEEGNTVDAQAPRGSASGGASGGIIINYTPDALKSLPSVIERASESQTSDRSNSPQQDRFYVSEAVQKSEQDNMHDETGEHEDEVGHGKAEEWDKPVQGMQHSLPIETARGRPQFSSPGQGNDADAQKMIGLIMKVAQLKLGRIQEIEQQQERQQQPQPHPVMVRG